MDNRYAFQQIVQDAVLQASGAGATAYETEDITSDDRLAEWIGKQVVRFLTDTGGQGLVAEMNKLIEYVNTGMSHYAALAERDSELAAALGACACWGEREDCEACGGAGHPGWRLPDQELFSALVVPALLTLTQSTASESRPDTHCEAKREETNDG